MTGRDLIKWILDNKAEDKQVEIQYRDEGGDYSGTDAFLRLEIEDARDATGWCYKRIVL